MVLTLSAKKYIVALTGGIASGKTTVGLLFKNLDIPVFDADDSVKTLLQQKNIQAQIKQLFPDAFDAQGLNKKLLKKIVFENDEHRQQLENILHPLVMQDLKQKINATVTPYCMVIIPLLFEKNLQSIADRILVVDITEEQQKQRAMRRDDLLEKDVDNIMRAQYDRSLKKQQAHDIIDNDGSEELLKQRVWSLHQLYLQESKKL